MVVEMKLESRNERGLGAELTEADLDAVVGGDSYQMKSMQLISTVLKDLHDIRTSIIRNVAG